MSLPLRICSGQLLVWTLFFLVLSRVPIPGAITPQSRPREVPGAISSVQPSSGHQKMLALLEAIKNRTPDGSLYLGETNARRLRQRLALLPESMDAEQRSQVHFELGESEIRLGNELEAISHYHKALDLLALPDATPHPNSALIDFRLGIAYLRRGETQNCSLNHNAESCIFPIRGGGIHADQGGSRQAIAHFTRVLESTRTDFATHVDSIWLLNLAHMTLGSHPDGVPPAYRIPEAAFESDEVFPQFANIASHLGLDTFSLAGGAVVDDFDNDHYLDLIVSSWDPAGQIRYFRNNRDGTFSDRTTEAGLKGLYGGLNLVQADYNNDGHLDLLVLRGGWLFHQGRHPNSLLRNNGDGTFRDVTFEAGMGDRHFPTQTASWADYDHDGDLDLYIGNESFPRVSSSPCQLFRNNDDGTFTEIARRAGVANVGFTKAVLWGDYDGDGWPDLYVSNFQEPNRLYRNQGDGTFLDVAWELGVDGPYESFPVWFWDHNNDGFLDLYVSAYAIVGVEVTIGDYSFRSSLAPFVAAYLDRPVRKETLPRLYQGNAKGGFAEVGKKANLVIPNAPMGVNFGDLDNDGYLDFYLGTGWPDYEALMPNLMYRNMQGERFADVTTSSGFGHLQKGHGVAFADLDNDGDQDIFEQMGGFYSGDKYFDALYENPGFGNHWIAVQLRGTKSNCSAIGARIRIDIIEDGKPRTIYKYVNSGGTFGANPLRQSIGLGKAGRVRELQVFWPATGKPQSFREVSMDRFIQIIEGEDEFSVLELEKVKLGSEH